MKDVVQGWTDVRAVDDRWAAGHFLSAAAAGADIAHGMSLEPTLEDQEVLANTFQRNRSRMTTRELLASVLAGAIFAAAVAGLWLISPPRTFALLPAALCVLVLAVAVRVQFDTPLGYTVPTQLVFVPLVFAVAPAIVPIAVVLAFIAGRLPDVVSGQSPPTRLLQMPGNSWFAIGPPAVLALTGAEASHAGPALLLAALAAQFAIDSAGGALRDWIAHGASGLDQFRYAWVYVVDAALSVAGLLAAKDVATTPVAVLALLPLLAIFAMFGRERHQRLQGLLELNSAYRGTALVLGDVVEADDSYTGEHCKSVVELALVVAQRLELTAEQRRNLEFGALLHDVGKIAIPKQILNKPGKLDPDEWTVIKTHTVEGQRMLDRVGGFMGQVGRIVRSHHERWDGAGYPDGLVADAIPLEARIIACCDTWNAMRTDRVYRKALSHPEAVAELVSNAGSQLDPRIVDTLLAVVAPAQQLQWPASPTIAPHVATPQLAAPNTA